MAVKPQQGDQRISQRSEVLRSMAGADPTGVFLKGDVADVMGTVFNVPMPAPAAQQFGRSRQAAGRAADGVVDFGRPLSRTIRGAG